MAMMSAAIRYCIRSRQTAAGCAWHNREKREVAMPRSPAVGSVTSGGSWKWSPTSTNRSASLIGPRQTGSVICPASSTMQTYTGRGGAVRVGARVAAASATGLWRARRRSARTATRARERGSWSQPPCGRAAAPTAAPAHAPTRGAPTAEMPQRCRRETAEIRHAEW